LETKKKREKNQSKNNNNKKKNNNSGFYDFSQCEQQTETYLAIASTEVGIKPPPANMDPSSTSPGSISTDIRHSPKKKTKQKTKKKESIFFQKNRCCTHKKKKRLRQ
jgi:hypothetical protein